MSGALHFVATGPDAYSVLDDLAMQRYTLQLERLHWVARDVDGEQVGPGEQFRNDAFDGLRSRHDAPQASACWAAAASEAGVSPPVQPRSDKTRWLQHATTRA